MQRIHLNSPNFATVDDEDFEYLSQWRWYFDGQYAYRHEYSKAEDGRKRRTKIYLQRFLLQTPKGMDTDHINGDKLDNRRSNLRTATRSQNNANRAKQPGCSSQYKGVCWFKLRNKWKAEIKVNRVKKHLGLFENEVDAALAYNAAALQAFGDFALTNTIN